jgi:ubiquinone/menaquinone biosynthesis C-methylase UbiE
VRQLAWRGCYEVMAHTLPMPSWSFMNYGFVPDSAHPQTLILDPADDPDRLCIQMYDYVIGDYSLTGRDVLEVGSGRGGGASYLCRSRAPNSVTGVDVAQRAVTLSQRDRRGAGLRFVQGDAVALPFADNSFDAVVNIESSHCYPSFTAFLDEVARVLRPGGLLAYADFRPRREVPDLLDRLAGASLTLVTSEDITANVLAALREDSDRKTALIEQIVPRLFRRPFRRFAAIQDSSTYDRFEKGELRYLCARLAAPQR